MIILVQISRAVNLDRQSTSQIANIAVLTNSGQFERVMGNISDEMIDPQEELAAAAIDASTVTIPSNMKAVIQFGYDQGMKQRLESEGSDDFLTWVTSVMTHTQAHYKHASLGTNIEFEVCE